MMPMARIYLLYLQTVLLNSRAQLHNIECLQISCIRNEPKQCTCTSTWQIKEVSDSRKHADTVNSLLTDTSIRWTPGAGPGRFSVINF